jgi:hypothetical protein
MEAGFWFEPVTFESARLGDPLTREEMATIESIARTELGRAFAGLNLRFSDRGGARFRVRVVQDVRDERRQGAMSVAGSSRGVAGFGGTGVVNFSFMASGAVGYAPEDATRAELVAAIGRGVGRGAVHELTHQLLPRTPIHQSTDVRSYEYYSAARPEQYFGDMQWGPAWPLLVERVGR